MMGHLTVLLRSSIWVALVLQGINGLIQLSAFLLLTGAPYLAFSQAYLAGTVLSLLLTLNHENRLLAGDGHRTIARHATLVWGLGLAACVHAWVTQAAVPTALAFCGWGVCFRLALAWFTHARPGLLGPALAGLLVLAACATRSMPAVMAAAMLAFPLVLWGAKRPAKRDDAGFVAETRESLGQFLRYLPHTAAGIVIGYVDRYAALNVVGGHDAELYLRSLQICSWAAFMIYPFVFRARAAVLHVGALTVPAAWRGGLLLGLLLAAAAGALLALMISLDKLPGADPAVVGLCFLAIWCAQAYQIISSLNFVGQHFSAINRITLTSAAVVLLLAAGLVQLLRTPESLACVLLGGWSVQVVLTLRSIRRRPLRT